MRVLIIQVCVCLLLTSCDRFAGEVSQHIGPIAVSVNTWGELQVTAEVPVFVSPLGVTTVGLVVEPTGHFKVDRTLTVRMDREDHFYELKEGQVGEIIFEPGYYRAISIQWRDTDLMLELARADEFSENPTTYLKNATELQASVGRVSCRETAFRPGMDGIVVEPVRLRFEPYIPENLNENWQNSLQLGENVTVLEVLCNEDGVWLQIQRIGGEVGWAKEWGLNEDRIETTFIVPR